MRKTEKGRTQRPLVVGAARGREQGPQVHSGRRGRSRSLPGPSLLHDPGALHALRAPLTRGWPQPGKMPSLAQESPVQKARVSSSSPAPLGSGAKELGLPSAFWRGRESRLAAAAPSANGAPGTRQGLFSGGGWPPLPPSPGPGRTSSQAETRLAGTSGSAPAELSTARERRRGSRQPRTRPGDTRPPASAASFAGSSEEQRPQRWPSTTLLVPSVPRSFH